MKQSPSPLIVRENVPLAPFTTLGIGGPARFLIEAQTEAQVMEALDLAVARGLPVFVLGGGSNILVSDAGFPGIVIKIALRGMEQTDDRLVVAGAGEDWDPFVRRCVEQELAGIECLSGIPGTVGGTPVQNVGAYGQEVSEAIVSARVLGRKTRRVADVSNKECRFAYRESIFNTSHREHYIVLSVTYALQAGGKPRIAHPDVVRYFAGRTDLPSLAAVREAVLRIRESKSMVARPGDPNARSAGSFFKNPIVPINTAAKIEEAAKRHGLLQEREAMPRQAMPGDMEKLPAAWLVEHAGFAKGYSRGRVGLSSKHTLSLINRGGATAQELVDLMRDIQTAVLVLFDVELAPEPVFVGFGER
jgi:UDP-N-acetylmuramate dehydrogenase